MSIMRLFLTVPYVGMQSVIVAFIGHTRLLIIDIPELGVSKAIMSQSSNATRKEPEFYTTNCCRAVYG